MKTQGEVEASIGEGIKKLYVSIFGRGPGLTSVNVLQTTVVMVSQNVLTAAERNMAENESGRKILKEMRFALVSGVQDKLKDVVAYAANVVVKNLHYSVSVDDGEEVFLFSLATVPEFRPKIVSKRILVRA